MLEEGSPIPIITFLHDLVSGVKGPYYRLVGRFTQRYIDRAAKRSANEYQKKVLFIAVAGADSFFTKVLCDQQQATNYFSRHPLVKRLKKQQLTAVIKIYLSTVLLLIGTDKELLLQKMGGSETEWMQTWCWVFEYTPEDMNAFNAILQPAYQSSGVDGLVTTAWDSILQTLAWPDDAKVKLDAGLARGELAKDVAAIRGVIDGQNGG
ncbi:MAG: hypothetical protein P4N59_26265 [Negativicutes bacterium]|nr:hypothetical protein [Negativicutes bacterium]